MFNFLLLFQIDYQLDFYQDVSLDFEGDIRVYGEPVEPIHLKYTHRATHCCAF